MSASRFPGNFSLEELKENGFMEASQISLNNLSYPVHHIFTNWINLSEDDVAFLRPTLHLASALFDSPASISFIHAIMYGRREKTTRRAPTGGELFELHKGPPVSDLVRHQVELGLRDLRRSIAWEVNDPEEGDAAQEIPARTHVLLDKKVMFWGAFSEMRGGFASEIVISKKVFNPIRKVIMDALNGNIEEFHRLLRLQFFMARLMCHELCHAINNGVARGNYESEPHYMNDNINELGSVWENEVFGGRIMANPLSEGREPFRVVKWPTERVPEIMEHGLVVRRNPKGSSTYYYISMDWIANIQKQENWNEVWNENPKDALRYLPYRNDENLLRIPKQIGVRVENERERDEAWRKSQSSEGGWEDEGEAKRVYRFEREPKTIWITGGETPVELTWPR